MDSTPNVLVLGGGVAGMAAAEALDGRGIAVHLVETRTRLGGHAYDWACMATDTCRHCGACLSAEMVDRMGRLTHGLIYLESRVEQISPRGEGFSARIAGSRAAEVEIDAVLLATGMQPFDPSRLESLSYAQDARVMTTADLNAVLRSERLAEILPPGESPAVGFVQCVGSRNGESGRDYCSQVCCKTALRQAARILHQVPGADVTIFNIDFQLIGKEFRSQAADLEGKVRLLQGVPGAILSGRQENRVTVVHEEFESGARRALHFDLIVLAVGMLPSAGLAATTAMLGAAGDDWGFLGGPGARLPERVYAAGAAVGPTDILSARQQGRNAADRLAADLGFRAPAAVEVAVIGGGAEARRTASALAADGCTVMLLDPGKGPAIEDENVRHHPGTRLIAVEGTWGQFTLRVATDRGRRSLPVGAVVVAVGAQVGSPVAVQPAGENIGSLKAFEARYGEAPERAPERVVFWLDRSGPEWKENDRRVLQQAAALAQAGRKPAVIMEKMLVHGLKGQRMYDRARRQGVRFLRAVDPAAVRVHKGEQALALEFEEATLPGIRLTVSADLLVVPDPVGPPPEADALAEGLGVNRDREGYLQPADVRQRPVGSRRRGIFFVGGCHDETDGGDLEHEIGAVAATLRALEVRTAEEDRPAVIDPARCGRCLTCFRCCPHGAVVLKAAYQPEIMAAACHGCGLCVSSCPATAISQPTEQTDPRPEPEADTVVFACERSGALAAREAAAQGMLEGAGLRLVQVPCAGRIDAETLLTPLLAGARRVVVAACHEGNCRSGTGSRSARGRVAALTSSLPLSDSEVAFHPIAANQPVKLAQVVNPAASKE